MQKMRDIAPITNGDLLIGIKNRRIGIGRILELNDTQRHTVDIQKNIRTAILLLTIIDIFYGKLVHGAEDIVFGMLKVNECNHAGKSTLRNELHAVNHPTVHRVKRGELALRTNKAHFVHNLMDFVGSQIRIGLAQKLLHIIHIQNCGFIFTRNAIAVQIVPSLCF